MCLSIQPATFGSNEYGLTQTVKNCREALRPDRRKTWEEQMSDLLYHKSFDSYEDLEAYNAAQDKYEALKGIDKEEAKNPSHCHRLLYTEILRARLQRKGGYTTYLYVACGVIHVVCLSLLRRETQHIPMPENSSDPTSMSQLKQQYINRVTESIASMELPTRTLEYISKAMILVREAGPGPLKRLLIKMLGNREKEEMFKLVEKIFPIPSKSDVDEHILRMQEWSRYRDSESLRTADASVSWIYSQKEIKLKLSLYGVALGTRCRLVVLSNQAAVTAFYAQAKAYNDNIGHLSNVSKALRQSGSLRTMANHHGTVGVLTNDIKRTTRTMKLRDKGVPTILPARVNVLQPVNTDLYDWATRQKIRRQIARDPILPLFPPLPGPCESPAMCEQEDMLVTMDLSSHLDHPSPSLTSSPVCGKVDEMTRGERQRLKRLNQRKKFAELRKTQNKHASAGPRESQLASSHGEITEGDDMGGRRVSNENKPRQQRRNDYVEVVTVKEDHGGKKTVDAEKEEKPRKVSEICEDISSYFHRYPDEKPRRKPLSEMFCDTARKTVRQEWVMKDTAAEPLEIDVLTEYRYYHHTDRDKLVQDIDRWMGCPRDINTIFNRANTLTHEGYTVKYADTEDSNCLHRVFVFMVKALTYIISAPIALILIHSVFEPLTFEIWPKYQYWPMIHSTLTAIFQLAVLCLVVHQIVRIVGQKTKAVNNDHFPAPTDFSKTLLFSKNSQFDQLMSSKITQSRIADNMASCRDVIRKVNTHDFLNQDCKQFCELLGAEDLEVMLKAPRLERRTVDNNQIRTNVSKQTPVYVYIIKLTTETTLGCKYTVKSLQLGVFDSLSYLTMRNLQTEPAQWLTAYTAAKMSRNIPINHIAHEERNAMELLKQANGVDFGLAPVI